MVSLTDRYLRQSDILDQDKLAQTSAVVVGVGAIGRQVALQLGTIGVRHLVLVDHDIVEPVNLGAQGYRVDQLDLCKVSATAADVIRQAEHCQTVIHAERFQLTHLPDSDSLVVFSCVDDMTARRRIFQAAQATRALFIDGRMAAEYIECYTCQPDCQGDREAYLGSLFSQAEAFRGRCTAQTTYYAACIAAGLLVSRYCMWLRGCSLPRKLTVDLLALGLD